MTTTGWTNEPPEGLPVTSLLLAGHEHRATPLETALARSRADDHREALEAAASAPDPDERAAGMVARGVLPGMVSDLTQRLGDTLAELQGEREKIERGQRRQEQVVRAHANGQITAFDIARMDLDEGDPAQIQRLERRAESLQRQIAETSSMIAPQQEREPDPVAEAGRHAHATFVEVTRAKMADATAGRPVRREPRPFDSASRGGVAVRSEQCIYCIADGVDPETSFLLHSDPELNVPVTSPEQADVALYAPGAVITTDYEQLRSEDGGPVIYR